MTALVLWPSGLRMAVIFAAQGVMKKQPTSLSATPRSAQKRRRASMAATSMGLLTSTMLSISSGKRVWMRRTTAGQLEEISGRGTSGSFIFSMMARLTMSAPWATSHT